MTARTVMAGAVAAALLAACGTAAGSTPSATGTTDGATPSATASPSAGPTAGAAVTVDNCGTEVTVTSPPQRVVTIKSTSTEMLLALGLQDVMIGTAFSDGPVPEAYEAAYQAIPVISESVPGQEALLALSPDFVYAGWESNFSADGAGERETLAGLGIGSYVSPAACKDPAYMPDPLTFDVLFEQMLEVAALVGVPERGEELVAAQRAALEAIEPIGGEVTALWYSSGTDTPYVGAGIGAPQMMMAAAGLTNIVADVHDTWTSVSWEAVVEADPDVIVLVDSAWNSVDKKIGVLEANPATSQLDAVQQGRYMVVPFPAAEAGVRNVEAVASLVEQYTAIAEG